MAQETIDQGLLRKEIYKIRVDGDSIFYAPLTRSYLLAEGDAQEEDLPQEWIDDASDVNNVPEFVRNALLDAGDSAVKVRFNITNGCNLSCSYCSVAAGSKKVLTLHQEKARTALEYFIRYCRDLGRKMEMTFSGGEPTTVIDFVESLIVQGKELAANCGVGIDAKLLTNGVFSARVRRRIQQIFDAVQVSWDGDLPDNPRYGTRSHIAHIVRQNICNLLADGTQVNVLTVVSEANQHELGQIVDDVYASMGGLPHFLSLKDALGRAKTSGARLEYSSIGSDYISLWKKYRQAGHDINLTGTDVHAISKYPCAVVAPNFSISPSGGISACTITFNDAAEGRFAIGSVAEEVKLDGERVQSLKRDYSIDNFTHCSHCFAKWHCRGSCPYAFRNGMPVDNPERCEMVQNIVANKIKWIIENEA